MVCKLVSPLHSRQKESKIILQAIHLFLLEGHLPEVKLGMVRPLVDCMQKHKACKDSGGYIMRFSVMTIIIIIIHGPQSFSEAEPFLSMGEDPQVWMAGLENL